MAREFPKKKSNPRNTIIPIAVTELQREALRMEAARRQRETGKDTGISTVAYEMLLQCNLDGLVAFYFPDASSNLPSATDH